MQPKYPQLDEYQAAVYHPATAFADPVLRAGTVAHDFLGLARPISGNFGNVFNTFSSLGRPGVSGFRMSSR